jgi:hypothetical protein
MGAVFNYIIKNESNLSEYTCFIGLVTISLINWSVHPNGYFVSDLFFYVLPEVN